MSSNQRAIRLTISGLFIIFGLISLSQAGFFIIQYLVLDHTLESGELLALWLGFWRGYWAITLAILLQLSVKKIFKSRKISLFIMISLGLTGYSYLNI